MIEPAAIGRIHFELNSRSGSGHVWLVKIGPQIKLSGGAGILTSKARSKRPIWSSVIEYMDEFGQPIEF